MSPVFMTKDGRLIVSRPHEATFNGVHNSCKSKVLIVLYVRKYKYMRSDGLSARELHRESGVLYSYLLARLGKWCLWGYLHRRATEGDTRPVYRYTIAERGAHFVRDIIPRDILDRYVKEIRRFRMNQ